MNNKRVWQNNPFVPLGFQFHDVGHFVPPEPHKSTVVLGDVAPDHHVRLKIRFPLDLQRSPLYTEDTSLVLYCIGGARCSPPRIVSGRVSGDPHVRPERENRFFLPHPHQLHLVLREPTPIPLTLESGNDQRLKHSASRLSPRKPSTKYFGFHVADRRQMASQHRVQTSHWQEIYVGQEHVRCVDVPQPDVA
jgi:hypothetical protein